MYCRNTDSSSIPAAIEVFLFQFPELILCTTSNFQSRASSSPLVLKLCLCKKDSVMGIDAPTSATVKRSPSKTLHHRQQTCTNFIRFDAIAKFHNQYAIGVFLYPSSSPLNSDLVDTYGPAIAGAETARPSSNCECFHFFVCKLLWLPIHCNRIKASHLR